MRGNRRADTKPERMLRSRLHAEGFRFRKDLLVRAGNTRVKADLVFPRDRVAVFVDGCFWHGCPEHGRQPQTNGAYWGPKLLRNVERDATVNEALRNDGWTVLRVWEHSSPSEAVEMVAAALAGVRSRGAGAVEA